MFGWIRKKSKGCPKADPDPRRDNRNKRHATKLYEHWKTTSVRYSKEMKGEKITWTQLKTGTIGPN